MRKDIINISNILADVEVATQRAYMLSNDLRDGSFSETVETPAAAWRMMLLYREREMVKLELVIMMLNESTKSLSYLQSAINKDVTEIEMNYEMAEIMDKYGCNKKLAELLYREKYNNREVD